MKRGIIIVGVVAIAVVAVIVGWRLGWFAPSPTSVFKDSITKANAGRYEEASQNLPKYDRELFLEDRIFMKRIWQTITKKGTISTVEITRENRDAQGTSGTIDFFITYKDGSTFAGTEKIAYEDGTWKHKVGEFFYELVDRGEEQGFEPTELVLGKEFKRIEGTGVSLQVAEGARYQPDTREFLHFGTGMRVGAVYATTPYSDEIDAMERAWTLPKFKLVGKQELERDKRWKCTLFEGFRPNARGEERRQIVLILGDEHRTVNISGDAPPDEALAKVLRDSILSAKWSPPKY